MISNNSSLAEFQELNKKIYEITNDRKYNTKDLLSRLHRNITHILKAVRKEKYDDITYRLCMALSWSFAIANRLHINLADEMWESFPGCCPYCAKAPCDCKKRRYVRQQVSKKPIGSQPVALFEWQEMFAKIYPNTVQNSAIHLAEEAGEIDEVITNYSATHNERWFRKIVEELVDLMTNIFGVANCLKIELATEMANYFADGCCRCHHLPCSCRYTTVDEPPISSKN